MHKTRKPRKYLATMYLSVQRALSTLDGYTSVYTCILNVCLEYGMPIEHRSYAGNTVLEKAVIHKRIARVELLIKYGANVNSGDGLPIRMAVWNESIPITDMLIKAGADVNLHVLYRSAISIALEHNGLLFVLRLLQAGATLPDNAITLARESTIDSAKKVEFLHALKIQANSTMSRKVYRIH